EGSSKGFLKLIGGEIRKGTEGLTIMTPGRMHFGVWTGNFEVIIPVIVNFPALWIGPLQSSGVFQIKAERRMPDIEETFVRLFPMRGGGIPRHIIVRKDTRVEFLNAYAEVLWRSEPHYISIEVKEEPWLRIRVNGEEGWIKDQEDLIAVGLPPAG
ncbi:MAG: hypothetical protein QMD85_04995, partial [Candidatus Aenigmarchaeota archaeon]|nr:hypothetical protein [Candidatus Aenigmarchaeota archaeon]